ncbi:MAG: tRNA preQ1(34) S-adenosylmethionine ribosyltransferase-isomerase QueA [Gammaproteobacteria bacterium]|nr:tRNA preQ1(34) S-adenosylmethionine ribosyltransferase-isomerase QueA [Gammaproteobacteria bacterium]
MKVSDFRYPLPAELIAREPPAARSGSRLLCLDAMRATLQHRSFAELPQLLRAGDLLLFNDTRVIAARMFGCKTATGGGVELLVERVLDPHRVLAQVRASKPPRPGSELDLLDGEGNAAVRVRVIEKHRDMYEIAFPADRTALGVMQAIGHVPLPPYIERPDDALDRDRYQTVYAARDGAVAAPTAGLHFDEAMLERVRAMGVETGFLTLHVGAGTFQSVRVGNVEEHLMHAEYVDVSADLCECVLRAHDEGRRVIAVGTTTLRALEAASTDSGIHPLQGETSIFIYPGYRFRCVDALITNFHLPESTLLMLVCAFAGRERVLDAYDCAVRERYRFFSYGDAMFIRGERPALLKTRKGRANG